MPSIYNQCMFYILYGNGMKMWGSRIAVEKYSIAYTILFSSVYFLF
jgi:hypothetical protein